MFLLKTQYRFYSQGPQWCLQLKLLEIQVWPYF